MVNYLYITIESKKSLARNLKNKRNVWNKDVNFGKKEDIKILEYKHQKFMKNKNKRLKNNRSKSIISNELDSGNKYALKKFKKKYGLL